MRTWNPIYICIPDSGHASFVRIERIESGFNPLTTRKKEGVSFERARRCWPTALFFDRSRSRKPCFSNKSCTIDEKYRCCVQPVQLLFEKWQFFVRNEPEKYCCSRLPRVQDYFSILYLCLTWIETFAW